MAGTMKITSAVAAAAALAAGGSAALASDMSAGSAFVMPEAGQVSISFKSSDAGAQGSLYFLGAGYDGAITYAASSDDAELGQFLFSNKNTSVGSTQDLGVFAQGAELHFAYIITSGVSVAPTGSFSRSDVASDLLFFGLSDPTFDGGVYTLRLGVEDVKNVQNSDFDYNDALFTLVVTPTSVPSPGSITLGACAALFLFSRRRPQR